MGMKRDFDATVDAADETPTKVKDAKRAKIDAWLAARQAKVTAIHKEAVDTVRYESACKANRKRTPATKTQRYIHKLSEIHEGLDTSKPMERFARSKPNLEKQVKSLEDRNDQIRKALKEAIDGLHGDLADILTSLEAVYKLTEPSPTGLDAAHKQAEAMYNSFLSSASTMNEAIWEEFYNDADYLTVNADRFAKAMARFLPDVEALLQQPHDAGVIFAFDLMMFLADHVHGELDTKGGSGYGDSEEPYALMDAMMMRVVTRRLQLEDADEDLTWVMDARKTLERKRDFLDQYGLEDYFTDTIRCLGELDGRRRIDELVVID